MRHPVSCAPDFIFFNEKKIISEKAIVKTYFVFIPFLINESKKDTCSIESLSTTRVGILFILPSTS